MRPMALIIVLLLVAACEPAVDKQAVDFSRTAQVAKPAPAQGGEHPLTMAVAAMTSPKETFLAYRQVVEYLAQRLGRPISLVQRKTYSEIDELLTKGELDVAFVCSGPYAAQGRNPGFELLAAPQIAGKTTYQAYLIVGRDSPYQGLEDLRGKVFAFTDPESNTGRLVPLAWLAAMGVKPEAFFSRSIFTYSHDNSIKAVARGLVDGAAVDGLVWEYFARRQPDLTERTRIVRVSEPYGIPPVVARSSLDPELRRAIQAALLAMAQDPEGRRILDALLIERFVPAQSAWYDSIRRLREGLNAALVQP